MFRGKSTKCVVVIIAKPPELVFEIVPLLLLPILKTNLGATRFRVRSFSPSSGEGDSAQRRIRTVRFGVWSLSVFKRCL